MTPVTPLRETAKSVIVVDGNGDAVEFTTANPVPVTQVSSTGATDGWEIKQTQDETANDSDKTFTVPASVEWQILWIWIEYTSTATVGDRQIVIQIQDSGSDIIAEFARAGLVQAASLTYNYLFAPSVADLTTIRDSSYLTTPIPGTSFLKAGDIIRVYDNNAVAAAADDMIIQIQYAEREIVP